MTKQLAQYPNLTRLLEIMAQLRHPEAGCPWDKAQDFASIVPFTLEEAYEVADVIERQAMDELPDELGDLLFQVVFYCQLGKEQGQFDFEFVSKCIADKLVKRHPHVFANLSLENSEQVKANWETLKAQERAAKQQFSILDNIPLNLPALSRAAKLQRRAAQVGFDWDNLIHVKDKVDEELQEVMVEVNAEQINQERVEDEVGDLLFAVVNLARHLKIDPEKALRQGNNKFERRFRQIEALVKKENKEVKDTSLEELETLWQQVKSKE